jgi:hypothetical protein
MRLWEIEIKEKNSLTYSYLSNLTGLENPVHKRIKIEQAIPIDSPRILIIE